MFPNSTPICQRAHQWHGSSCGLIPNCLEQGIWRTRPATTKMKIRARNQQDLGEGPRECRRRTKWCSLGMHREILPDWKLSSVLIRTRPAFGVVTVIASPWKFGASCIAEIVKPELL